MIDAGTVGPSETVRIPDTWWCEASLDEISWLRDHARRPKPGFEVSVEEDIRDSTVIIRRRPVTPAITTVEDRKP